ncbi:hypothetical protein G7Y79_00036g071790 [Physcia stellaris]|nr:hypothetical protein G7Y79_00036g071790 [Physcia stellaris]
MHLSTTLTSITWLLLPLLTTSHPLIGLPGALPHPLPSLRQGNSTLDPPFPQPVPVPGRAFNLQFYERRKPLKKAGFDKLYALSKGILQRQVHDHGDSPLIGAWLQGDNDLAFSVIPAGKSQPLLTYNSTLDILNALRKKEQHDGYFGWYALIRANEDEKYLGLMSLGGAFGRWLALMDDS